MPVPLHKVRPSRVGLYAVLNWGGSSLPCLNFFISRPLKAVSTVDFLTFLTEECVYKFLASLVAACHLKKLPGVYLRTNNTHSKVVKLNSVQADMFSDRITAHGIVSKWRKFLKLHS